jgi:hypothetical protein
MRYGVIIIQRFENLIFEDMRDLDIVLTNCVF